MPDLTVDECQCQGPAEVRLHVLAAVLGLCFYISTPSITGPAKSKAQDCLLLPEFPQVNSSQKCTCVLKEGSLQRVLVIYLSEESFQDMEDDLGKMSNASSILIV